MEKYQFSVTHCIVKDFEKYNVPYTVDCVEKYEVLTTVIPLYDKPVKMFFFVENDDNKVYVMIKGIVSDIPKESYDRIRDACNCIHEECILSKFILDENEGEVYMDYTFYVLPQLDDSYSCGAAMAAANMMCDLNAYYHVLMTALHTKEDLVIEKHYNSELMKARLFQYWLIFGRLKQTFSRMN